MALKNSAYTALKRAEAELSNAVASSIQKPRSGEWLAGRSELESARLSMGLLNRGYVSIAELVSCVGGVHHNKRLLS